MELKNINGAFMAFIGLSIEERQHRPDCQYAFVMPVARVGEMLRMRQCGESSARLFSRCNAWSLCNRELLIHVAVDLISCLVCFLPDKAGKDQFINMRS